MNNTKSGLPKNWNIVELHRRMLEDLNDCHTVLERNCCQALCLREIVELARHKKGIGRKLTPGEQSVIDHYQLNV